MALKLDPFPGVPGKWAISHNTVCLIFPRNMKMAPTRHWRAADKMARCPWHGGGVQRSVLLEGTGSKEKTLGHGPLKRNGKFATMTELCKL